MKNKHTCKSDHTGQNNRKITLELSRFHSGHFHWVLVTAHSLVRSPPSPFLPTILSPIPLDKPPHWRSFVKYTTPLYPSLIDPSEYEMFMDSDDPFGKWDGLPESRDSGSRCASHQDPGETRGTRRGAGQQSPRAVGVDHAARWLHQEGGQLWACPRHLCG